MNNSMELVADKVEQEAVAPKPDKSTPSILLGKSLPRSGHHFLLKLLAASMGQDFNYCEMYTNRQCCKSYPCTSPKPGLIFLQKSHDFRLEDPIVESCKYLIQYRHPVPRLFSDWDLAVTKFSHPDSEEHFIKFARTRRRYYITFFEKWIVPFANDSRFFMMSYESLVAEPLATVQNLIRFATDSEDFEIDRLAVLKSGLKVKSSPNIQTHKYYDPEFLNEYQTTIIKRLPNFPYLPLSL